MLDLTHQKTGALVRTPFPFMKLPTELRLKVYRELLQSKNDLRMKCHELGMNHLHPNILRTCHQVCKEAMEVLYGENIFYVHYIDRNNPNALRVKRGRSYIFATQNDVNKRHITALIQFLHDHPDLTHLFFCFGKDVEVEGLQVAVEQALQGHNGPINLEINVHTPLTPKSTAFCWRLFSIVRRNRPWDSERLEEMTSELYDAVACPPFVKL
jgi:hypothetical protein